MSAVLLSAAELRLFQVLRSHYGRAVPMASLIEAAGCVSPQPSRVVIAMLSRIRREFKKAGLSNPIKVKYRVGYWMTAPAMAVAVADRSAKRAAIS